MEQLSDLDEYIQRELSQKFRLRLDKSSGRRFNKWLKNRRDYDIARLVEDLSDTRLDMFLNKVNSKNLAGILEECRAEMQKGIISRMAPDSVIDVFQHMSSDIITDILNQLSGKQARSLLRQMDPETASNLRQLMDYPEETAGSLMTTDFISFNGQLTSEKALERLKNIDGEKTNLDKIFIVNESQQLQGKIELKDLLTMPGDRSLQEITGEDIITVQPDMDQEQVSRLVAQYDLKVIPVVDEERELLGIITVDDIIDVIQEESTEDMLKMVGIDKEERIGSSLIDSIKNRLPWLYINLATAFLAAAVVGVFEDVIARVVALAVAMPIVAGMGGNAGSQTLAIVIREIALGNLSFKENWRVVVKEAILGLIHGAAIGLVTALILFINYNNLYLGLIIFLAVVANLVMAGLSGFLIPVTLKALGLDPALSAAIFLTTVTDVFGFFVFLGLAQLVLEYL